jgi:hypothetical protein
MKTLLFCLLPCVVWCAAPDIKDIPWPKCVCEFPSGDEVTEAASFKHGDYQIDFSIPTDRAIQASGGSGGPMVEITLRDLKGGWKTKFLTQSIGQRLLESWNGRPQIETWGRGGGGYYVRILSRFIDGEYREIRVDEFEKTPSHKNENTATATLPDVLHGRGIPNVDTLHFVETRLLTNDVAR